MMEAYEERVDELNRRLRELALQQVGLVSQNELLEKQAASIAEKAHEEEGLWSLETGAHLAAFANRVRGDSLVMEVTPQAARKMTVADIAELFKELFVKLIGAAQADAPEAEQQTIATLLSGKTCFRRALESMPTRKAVDLLASLNGLYRASPPSLHAMLQLLEETRLTDAQRRELTVMRQRRLRKHRESQADCARVAARIQEVMASGREAGDQISPDLLLQGMEVLEDLRRSLAAALEHACSFDAAVCDALTPRQYAGWLLFARGGGCPHVWLLVELVAAQELAASTGPAAAAAEFPDMAAAFVPAADSSDGQAAVGQDVMVTKGGLLPVDPLLGELSSAGLLDQDYSQPASQGQADLCSLLQSLSSYRDTAN